MNWRWIPFIVLVSCVGILSVLMRITAPAEPGACWFGGAFVSFVVTAISSIVPLGTRWAQRQDELKKPFGAERVQIMNQKWRLEDAKRNLTHPDHLDSAIKQCDDQLIRIDRAIASLYESRLSEQGELVEQIEEVVRRTQEDLQQPQGTTQLASPQRSRV